MGRRNSRKRREKAEKKSKRILFVNFLPLLLILLVVGYLIYMYVSFGDIKSENPIEQNNASYYLLSNAKDTLEKTLIVFEEEYNEKERIKSAYMYAENKDKGAAVLVYLPGWVEYGGVEGDFGSAISISTFRYAGEFLQEGRGIEYAIWQFEQLLGSNIDNYIWFTSSATNLFIEKLEGENSSSLYAQYYANGFESSEEVFFMNSLASKLGWFNLLTSSSKFKESEAVIYSSHRTVANTVIRLKQIYQSTLSLRPYIIDLSNGAYLLSQASSSGVGISNYIDVSKYDSKWGEFIEGIIDKELEKERVRVEVYNGSDLPGYAAQYARRIRNSGCDVVRYDNAPSKQQNTQFYVPNPEEFDNSLEIILELFPGSQEIVEGRPAFMTTGDIVIVLGEDIPTAYSF